MTTVEILVKDLPPIPDKRYFTIGEVSTLCEVKAHVLRYWEQEFKQLSPLKRRGNRRYYQQHDVELIRTIRQFLYEHGYTIDGARRQLEANKPKRKSKNKPSQEPAEVNTLQAIDPVEGAQVKIKALSADHQQLLKESIEDLKNLLVILESKLC